MLERFQPSDQDVCFYCGSVTWILWIGREYLPNGGYAEWLPWDKLPAALQKNALRAWGLDKGEP